MCPDTRRHAPNEATGNYVNLGRPRSRAAGPGQPHECHPCAGMHTQRSRVEAPTQHRLAADGVGRRTRWNSNPQPSVPKSAGEAAQVLGEARVCGDSMEALAVGRAVNTAERAAIERLITRRPSLDVAVVINPLLAEPCVPAKWVDQGG